MKKTVKKQIRLIVLALFWGVLCTGCTKEEASIDANVAATTNAVTYIVDGQHYYANPQTEEEWSAFFERMFALAEEGYTVRFWNNNTRDQTAATKDVVTFSTSDKAKAEAWRKEKMNAGYDVSMTYNQETGEYDCIAVK